MRIEVGVSICKQTIYSNATMPRWLKVWGGKFLNHRTFRDFFHKTFCDTRTVLIMIKMNTDLDDSYCTFNTQHESTELRGDHSNNSDWGENVYWQFHSTVSPCVDKMVPLYTHFFTTSWKAEALHHAKHDSPGHVKISNYVFSLAAEDQRCRRFHIFFMRHWVSF